MEFRQGREVRCGWLFGYRLRYDSRRQTFQVQRTSLDLSAEGAWDYWLF
jgi:hypothetical protein